MEIDISQIILNVHVRNKLRNEDFSRSSLLMFLFSGWLTRSNASYNIHAISLCSRDLLCSHAHVWTCENLFLYCEQFQFSVSLRI